MVGKYGRFRVALRVHIAFFVSAGCEQQGLAPLMGADMQNVCQAV